MIVVGFSRGRSWLAAAIRWFTGSSWAHCWIEYPSRAWGGRWIAHATGRGVLKELAQPKLDYWRVLARYEVRAPGITQGMEACRMYVGKPYDFMAIVGHVIRLVAHWATGRRFFNPSRDAARLTCSEFVARILQGAGVKGTETWDPESIAPGDIEKLCSASDDFHRL
jgi:hypothetical protein